jgi:ribA/ribD-fused uncharacterized protein
MKTTDKMVLFWGGKFSQWYPHKMTIDGIEYNCCEQYMMAQKAILFQDQKALTLIMAAKDPRDQKRFGRMVENFNGPMWDRIAQDVVYRANLEKFSNDEEMKKYILATDDKEIVEASPYDKIWGIGLGEEDPRALDKAQWQGTNFLGEALMRVRETLKKGGVL